LYWYVSYTVEYSTVSSTVSIGRGELVLHVVDQRITGTLIIGKHTVTVKGERLH
jgi:hypothetical protein